jgi:hypothetical protein
MAAQVSVLGRSRRSRQIQRHGKNQYSNQRNP